MPNFTSDKKFAKTQAEWESLPERRTIPERGLFINVDGPEGTGKTSFALTLAKVGEIAYADIDQSIDRAQRPTMPKGKAAKIRVLPIRYGGGMGAEVMKAAAQPAWTKLRTSTTEAAKSWATGGVIVDTGTESWELLRLAKFGTVTPKGRTDRLYGPVNGEYRQWIRTIQRHHMRHLIFINQMKDQWKDKVTSGGEKVSVRTGKLERVGFKELGYLADMTFVTYKRGSTYGVRLEMCKLAPNGPVLEGNEWEDDEVDLLTILAQITDTQEKEWYK